MSRSPYAISRGVTPNGASPAAPPSGAVSTQMPPSCTATLCSQWEPAVPSSVETVQSSSSTNVAWSPITTIGSIASTSPGRTSGPGSGDAVVEDRRRLVHLAADAVPDILAQDAVAAVRGIGLDVVLHGGADLADVRRGGERGDAGPERPLGHIREPLPLGDDVGTGGIGQHDRERRVAVPALVLRAGVDREDVARLEHAIAGDPVHDLLVDRRADRVAVAAHHLEVRLRTSGGDDSGCRGIQFRRRHPRRDQRARRIECGGGDQPGLDHRPQLGGRLVDRTAQGHDVRPRPRGSRPRPSSAAMTRSVISSSEPTPSISSTMPRSR